MSRRELLGKVATVVSRYVAKRSGEWTPVKKWESAAMKFEAGKTYRISEDGEVSQASTTSPSLQLFSSRKVSFVTTNASDADNDLQKMREKLGVGKKPPKLDMDQETLERIIYQIRDEWCAATGEWDGSKIPVSELAPRLIKKLNEVPW
jgi:hypothetical protein